jgi:hypothetical protein
LNYYYAIDSIKSDFIRGAVKKHTIKTLIIMLSLILINCVIDQENSLPTLSSISPTSIVSHMPTFTLTVYGENFDSSSKIIFNGIEKQTSFVSSTELTCQIDPIDTVLSESMLTNAMNFNDILSESVPVKVQNPGPEGSESNSLSFMIHSNHAFDVPINISNTAGKSRYSAISTDAAGNINVVWEDYFSDFIEIYFCNSADNGKSWSQPINISNNVGDLHNPALPAISADIEGCINVVWEDYTSGYSEIFFSCSTNNGINWSQPVNISNTEDKSRYPAISTDKAGNINVVWARGWSEEGALLFSRSTNNGLNWSQPIRISNNPHYAWDQAISTDAAGNINVAYDYAYTPHAWDIYFSRSTDKGISWSQPIEISNDPSDLMIGAISTDPAGNIYVVWGVGKGHDIYFSRSTDNGVSWSQDVTISDTDVSNYPAMSTDPAGNINIVWEFGTDIGFTRSIDGGLSWSQPIKIPNSDNVGRSQYPAISTDSAGNIHIVWQENYPGMEIFFTSSTR